LVVRNGVASFFGESVGFYELQANREVVSRFAANFVDPHESSLDVRSELTYGAAVAAAPAGFSPGLRREVWGILLMVVLALSIVEWFTFHRRVTV
jgi:hypothetical protein